MRPRLLLGGLLDRYVAQLFGYSYLAAFFLVVGLYAILDMAANLDDYLRPGPDGEAPSFFTVARYYALQLPFLYLAMSPFVTLVGGLFTAAWLTRNNEIVAALGAGVSARRLLASIFGLGILLSLLMFVMREYVTDELGARRDVLQDRLLERRKVPRLENFWVTEAGGRRLRVTSYMPAHDGQPIPSLEGLICHYRDGERLVSLRAESATWDAAAERWIVQGCTRLVTDEHGKEVRQDADLTGLDFRPEDLALAWKGRERPMDLSFSECRRLLARDPDNTSYRTLLHYHLTFPLAGLVLLAVGLPFVASQRRGRGMERVAAGLVLCVAYFGTDFVSRTLGLQGHLGPIHAGWLPALLFGSLGVVMLGTMRS